MTIFLTVTRFIITSSWGEYNNAAGSLNYSHTEGQADVARAEKFAWYFYIWLTGEIKPPDTKLRVHSATS